MAIEKGTTAGKKLLLVNARTHGVPSRWLSALSQRVSWRCERDTPKDRATSSSQTSRFARVCGPSPCRP